MPPSSATRSTAPRRAVQDSGCAGGPTEAPDVSVTAIDKGAVVSWDAITGADSYDVYRTDGVFACNFGKIKVGNTTDTTFTEVGLQNGRTYYYSVIAVGANTACFSPMSACQTVVPVAGPNLAVNPGSDIVINTGDGDPFLDNCESATLSFTVSNTGTGTLTNVQLVSVTPLTHPTTVIDTVLPAPISASLVECDTANGSFNFTPHGMSFGETTQLLVEVSADDTHRHAYPDRERDRRRDRLRAGGLAHVHTSTPTSAGGPSPAASIRARRRVPTDRLSTSPPPRTSTTSATSSSRRRSF